ncbi:ASCH domain-containing protein [Corynebacterium antarcticum]|uniref:ASCH domain-containing protein n=1 Tax=Corynebacterium antarcticum TaxID=2800405 RepID=UPI003D0316A7
MRDALVAAILGGEKTATSTQLREHEAEGTDPRAPAATREVVVDSDNRPVCVIETTDAVIRPFGEAGDEFAPDRGRGVHDRPGVGVGAPRVPAQHRIPRSDRRSPLTPSATTHRWCAPVSAWCSGGGQPARHP